MILSKSARLVFANWDDIISNFKGATNVDVVSHVKAREIFRELRDLGVIVFIYEGGRDYTIEIEKDEIIDFLTRAAQYEIYAKRKGEASLWGFSPLRRR